MRSVRWFNYKVLFNITSYYSENQINVLNTMLLARVYTTFRHCYFRVGSYHHARL
jgi:hypothetical protein